MALQTARSLQALPEGAMLAVCPLTTVIPFKGRPAKHREDEDKPVNHVRALPERAQVMEIRFPVVEGYVFALKKNLIRCDVDKMEATTIEPDRTPTATFVSPAVGYRTGHASQGGGFGFEQHNRSAYYASTHLQTIQFALAQRIVAALAEYPADGSDKQRRVLRLQSRHQLFPQVHRFVEDYVNRHVDFRDENPCELGLEKYVKRIEGLFLAAITPDESQGETPLLPNGLISFRLEGSPNASRATRCGHCTRSYRADAVTFMAPFSERVLDAGRC